MKKLFRALIIVFPLLIKQAAFSQPGKNGAQTISSSTILNGYSPVTTNLTIGSTTVNVVSQLTLLGLCPGDLIMIYQAQGASITTTNSINYGSVAAYNSAGIYEFSYVNNVNGNTINLSTPLVNAYITTGMVQVVKVPQYTSLTVSPGALVHPKNWKDTIVSSVRYRFGGIVAVHASTIINSGTITATGAGFRGGQLDVINTSAYSSGIVDYVSTINSYGGEKGESIAGYQQEYDLLSGRYGRGAPANGGGGGNGWNAGGGGGANGDNGNTWTGQGVMVVNSSNPNAAWALDPGYVTNGNTLTNSSGGGRGGYSVGNNNQNPTVVAPGNSLWGLDQRREVGGLGGRPLTNIAATNRIYFGGGGGAGDENNANGGAGGDGGGIVYLIVSAGISGSGLISSNGNDGFNTTGNGWDAPGGAGAGGSIIIKSSVISLSQVIQAKGGKGGEQFASGNENEGPGGGGGGGFVGVSSTLPVSFIAGGTGGSTNCFILAAFPFNGATFGAIGQTVVVTNTFIPFNAVTIFTATSNSSVCVGSALQFSISSISGTYNWTGPNNFSSGLQNPTINNVTNSAAGIYSVIITPVGCSSLSTTTTVYINPVPVFTLGSNSPVCSLQSLQFNSNGGLFYAWAGPANFISFSQNPVINPVSPINSGVYNLTVTAANTCTASTSITAVVNSSPTLSAIGSTVCVSQSITLLAFSIPGVTYMWSGPNSFTSNVQNPIIVNPAVSASGVYTVKITNAGGCINFANVNVMVSTAPVFTVTSNSHLCAGDVLLLNSSGTNNNAVFYTWIGPNGFSSLQANPSINNISLAANGIYSLNVTAGPCTVSATHSVTVNSIPALTVTNSSPLCETMSLSLNAITSGSIVSYLWNGPLNFYSNVASVGRNPSKISFSGNYTITVMDINSCKNSAVTSVTIYPNPHVTTSGATVCLHQPAVISANGAASYWWTGPGFFSSSLSSPTVSSTNSVSTIVYTVVGTANSCTASATASVLTLALPEPSASVLSNTVVCLNDKITLQGFGGYSYYWSGPGNILFSGETVVFAAENMLYSGQYTLTAADIYGCKANAYANIVINNLPQGYLMADKKQSCVPFCSDFKFYPAANSSASTTITWEIDRQFFTGETFSCCFSRPGDYPVTGRIKNEINGCVNTINYTVNAYPLPVADFTWFPVIPIEDTEDVIFTNTSSSGSVTDCNWFFVNNAHKSHSENASYYFHDAGLYPVALVVRSIWGCLDTVVKVIKIDPDFAIYVPNTFTPNEDDKNEIFFPVGHGIKQINFSVFDRWGEKIFETNQINTGWDGTYNGYPCKSDVYVWKINVSGLNGEMKSMNGYVTLYR